MPPTPLPLRQRVLDRSPIAVWKERLAVPPLKTPAAAVPCLSGGLIGRRFVGMQLDPVEVKPGMSEGTFRRRNNTPSRFKT